MQRQYLAQSGLVKGLKSFAAKVLLHYIRGWDSRSSNGVDVFVTNSRFVSRRIQKTYRRDSLPIYPPVDVDKFTPNRSPRSGFLTASRLVPYKRIDVIIDAFNRMPDKQLTVIGDGPEFKALKAKAKSNVTMMGYQSFDVLRKQMQSAEAFVFAAEEDFGIVPVEAQACGTPVIAYNRGGAAETVIEGETGIFFREQTADSIIEAVREFEAAGEWSVSTIRRNAERFDAGRFREQFAGVVESEWIQFGAERLRGTAGGLPLTEARQPRWGLPRIPVEADDADTAKSVAPTAVAAR
jgi:glycosyltransferase involved in cell wall biosynthesis